MTIILAIETSTDITSVALLKNHEIFSYVSLETHVHSEIILPLIQQLLIQVDVKLSDCDAIAFGAGPGSFTGIRMACGVVQGLAFSTNIPVVPVITLEAMAQACLEIMGANEVLAILDAHIGEVYWAQYKYINTMWKEIVKPTLSKVTDIKIYGNPLTCGKNLITSYEGGTFQKNLINIRPNAIQIAILGYQAWKRKATISFQNAQPFYLRNKVSFTIAERQEHKFCKNNID